MGTFQKVPMGLGDLTVGGVDIGYLKDSVEYHYEYDIEKFYAGNPQKLKGQVTTGLNSYITAKYAELSAENLAMALGGLTITNQTAVEATVAMGAALTFATDSVTGLEYIQLGTGPGLSNAFNTLVVKNSAEAVTYTAGTDYLLEPTRGRVYRNPAGTITSLQVVHVGYKHTPITGKRIDLGVQFDLDQVPVVFTHTRRDGLQVIANMWLASSDAKVNVKFGEKTFQFNDIRIDAIEDTSHASNPFGYLFEETA